MLKDVSRVTHKNQIEKKTLIKPPETSETPQDKVEVGTQHDQAGVRKKWLVLNYIAADCNLQALQMAQIDDEETVGSDANTHLVAQIDRGPTASGTLPLWPNCRRYYITHDETPKVMKSDMLEDLGPTKMSSYEILRDFVVWGMKNFPAEHVMVILNDHGGATAGAMSDDTQGGIMPVDGLAKAFREAKEITRQEVDIVCYDACLMATTEVAYEHKDTAKILLASEETEGGNGISYKPVFEEKLKGGLKYLQESLRNRLTVSPKELAEKIVRINEDYPLDIRTFSATDLSKIDDLKDATDQLAERILNTPQGQKAALRGAIRSAQGYYYYSIRDEGDVAKKIMQAIKDGKIQDQDGKFKGACQGVVDVISGNPEKGIEPLIFAEEHTSKYAGSTGMTIATSLGSNYRDLAFGKDSKWKEAMEYLYGKGVLDQPPPKTFPDGSLRQTATPKTNKKITSPLFDNAKIKKTKPQKTKTDSPAFPNTTKPAQISLENTEKTIESPPSSYREQDYVPVNGSPLHLAVYSQDIEQVKKLLTEGVNVNAKDDRKSTPLHFAAQSGNKEIIELLLDKKADINAKDEVLFSTPLHYACQHENANNKEAVELLLRRGADVKARDVNEWTPLHLAATSAHKDVIDVLLTHNADINAFDTADNTPLNLSIMYKGDLAKTFIEKGANVHVVNAFGETTLHLATKRPNKEIVKILIDKDVPVNPQNLLKKTALHNITAYRNWASCAGDIKDIVQMILDKSADVNVQEAYFNTPLHNAAYYGNVEVAKMLLAKGSDTTLVNSSIATPLHLLVSSPYSMKTPEQVQAGKELISILQEKNTPINARDGYGNTALFYAVQTKPKEITEAILQKNADVNIPNYNNETPLHQAATVSDDRIMEMLLLKGAKVNVQDNKGITPLHKAVAYGNKKAVELLIKNNADVMVKDNDGNTPLLLLGQNAGPLTAEKKKALRETADLLIKKGADVTATNNHQQTALHKISGLGVADVTELLLKKNASLVNMCDEDGLTALHCADNRETGEILLKHNAEIEAPDNSGQTPLHKFACRGKKELAELLALKANFNAQDLKGNTPLIAMGYVDTESACKLKDALQETALFLISNGSEVMAKNNNGLTPLHSMSSLGLEEAVKVLLVKGANAKAEDKNGVTPLHLAFTEETVNLLLEKGADIEAKTKKEGWTPLHYTVANPYFDIDNSYRVVSRLADKGANVNAKDKKNAVPLHSAAQIGDPTMTNLLLSCGAEVNPRDDEGATPLDYALDNGNSDAAWVLQTYGGIE